MHFIRVTVVDYSPYAQWSTYLGACRPWCIGIGNPRHWNQNLDVNLGRGWLINLGNHKYFLISLVV